MILNAGQDVCQIDLRIEAMEFGCLDNGQDIGDALTALIRACKKPVLSANAERAHRPFGNVVVDFDTPIVDVNAQCRPSRQGISHCFSQLLFLRQSRKCLLDPDLQVSQNGTSVLLSQCLTLGGRHAANAIFDTVASYRDTFKLFLRFAHGKTGKAPSSLMLEDFDAELVIAFLDDLTAERRAGTTTYNLRLTAIRAFFRFLAFEEPAFSHQIQRVLAIPGKIGTKREVQFLVRDEIKALLAAPDRRLWIGRRDHCILLTAIQTGMRLSELVGLDRGAVTLDAGAHIRCFGKGRKERVTPLTKILSSALKKWLDEPRPAQSDILFPTVHGSRMSPDAVQYLLAKYVKQAAQQCPSLRAKRISPHVLRHSAAMELLDAGVDSTVISLWLGHESTRSTQAYLHAHLAIKEAALAKVSPLNEQPFRRFKANDKLLSFLDAL